MKYTLIQLILFLSVVIILYYFSTVSYFVPIDASGAISWYNFSIVLFLLFIGFQAFVGLIVFWGQKLLVYGMKEFPSHYFSLKWGLGTGLTLVVMLLLNIFHLLSLEWGIAISLILFIGFIFLF